MRSLRSGYGGVFMNGVVKGLRSVSKVCFLFWVLGRGWKICIFIYLGVFGSDYV